MKKALFALLLFLQRFALFLLSVMPSNCVDVNLCCKYRYFYGCFFKVLFTLLINLPVYQAICLTCALSYDVIYLSAAFTTNVWILMMESCQHYLVKMYM